MSCWKAAFPSTSSHYLCVTNQSGPSAQSSELIRLRTHNAQCDCCGGEQRRRKKKKINLPLLILSPLTFTDAIAAVGVRKIEYNSPELYPAGTWAVAASSSPPKTHPRGTASATSDSGPVCGEVFQSRLNKEKKKKKIR